MEGQVFGLFLPAVLGYAPRWGAAIALPAGTPKYPVLPPETAQLILGRIVYRGTSFF